MADPLAAGQAALASHNATRPPWSDDVNTQIATVPQDRTHTCVANRTRWRREVPAGSATTQCTPTKMALSPYADLLVKTVAACS